MALLNPTFVFGILVLLYLSTFVFFAVVRILTGVSIQRIGYFSLRRLAYTPRDGFKIEVRGLGLLAHRPTFAQPTWLSIVVSELVVSIDSHELEAAKSVTGCGPGDDEDQQQDGEPPLREVTEEHGDRGLGDISAPPDPVPTIARRETSSQRKRSETWRRLMRVKERVKRLHRNVNWLRMVDVVAVNSSISIAGVGGMQFGSLTVAVDTRRKMVDRARFFLQPRSRPGNHQAEWIMTLRSVLFTPEGKEPMEILDNATLNIHGFLYEAMDGLRDAAVALKLGRVHLSYDDIRLCIDLYRRSQRGGPKTESGANDDDGSGSSMDDVMQELQVPGSSTDQELMQTVSDSKEFVSSLLRGVKEVQFAVSFLGLTKKVEAAGSTAAAVLLNASMKEVGIDLHRLDPKSPAHRMYFPSKDIAHEALAAALSISAGVDDGQGSPQRLVYVPMATTTVRTTLPSKTVELADDGTAEQRNANILFANSVVTSPSVDLDPRHLPLLLALLRPSRKPRARRERRRQQRHLIISRLLPKATIKFTMHEPVLRIALPPVHRPADTDDFDLIISSISSVSLDVDSLHSVVEDLDYSLASSMRLQSHSLYYQTSSGSRFDLLETESFDLRVHLGASPDVHVVATGSLQTFSVKMVRPEISDGLRQIVRQLRRNVDEENDTHRAASHLAAKHHNFLRAMPAWLLHFQLQASDFGIEVAGVDSDISEDSRGLALQLESWSAEYRAQRLDSQHQPAHAQQHQRRPSRRRASSRASIMPEVSHLLTTVPISPRKKYRNAGDGRRIAIHARGLEMFVVESSEKWEVEPFVNVPRFEAALSTLSDNQGPVFHVLAQVGTLLVQYSLYRHYAVGVAAMVLRRVFVRSEAAPSPNRGATTSAVDHLLRVPKERHPTGPGPGAGSGRGKVGGPGPLVRELVALDLKAALIQVKADMPSDPPMMLQLHSLEAGRHRWSPPFFHCKLVRLYAGAPRMRGIWARVVSIKNGRLDYRESRKKTASGIQEGKMFDVVTDAIRVAVPHELIVNKISDNLINVFKSVEQLHHRFYVGRNEYIVDKGPAAPRVIPKVSLRSRTLLFELEDGAFEWKLGVIYRCGRVEQLQRLAREEAFKVKVKKIHDAESRKESSKFRTRSALGRGRSSKPTSRAAQMVAETSGDQGGSGGVRRRSTSEGSQGKGRRTVRGLHYDPEGASMSGNAQLSVREARQRLDEHNAHSWRRRIDRQFMAARNRMRDARSLFWGADHLPDDLDDHEHILEVPQRPALMATLVHDLHLTVDRPSFPMRDLPHFLHKVGKGMPLDTRYSLLIPMSVSLEMGETKVTLRDYPLPLLHVPALKAGQSSRLPALALRTDFVIAEEYRGGAESIRRVRVAIVPPVPGHGTASTQNSVAPGSAASSGGFAVDVRRTVGPVKSYSDMSVDINTGLPTRITWGPSYQPAIQDMMMAIESFTKPQLDPSERVGFWDKIRLNFHSRVRVAWKGEGEVHLALKGTRDPYQLTGDGAGFLMCWRNDVRWNIHVEDDPTRFMTVDSGEYVLAVPDLSHHTRVEAARFAGDQDDGGIAVAADGPDGASSGQSHYSRDGEKYLLGGSSAAFQKVIMKLSGRVQWLAGLVFERSIEGGRRSFEFRPHYDVVLKTPQAAVLSPEWPNAYDAFRGFRSQHIHLSLAVRAPEDREWTPFNPEPSRGYNTVHLTPRFFTHFFAWWSLFAGPMSLPVRQGLLWPGREKNSKKFGRHLATIKYNLLFAPLFLSHIYKHKGPEDPERAPESPSDTEAAIHSSMQATGIKVRFDSFMLDLHQRREEFNTRDRGSSTQSRTTGMKIHAGQLDLASVDVRAVSATIKAAAAARDMRDTVRGQRPPFSSSSQGLPSSTFFDHDPGHEERRGGAHLDYHGDCLDDLSRFNGLDAVDFYWIDTDDFVELDAMLPMVGNPDVKILPLAYAPRVTYFRQTDIGGIIAGDPERSSPFGDEPTHRCFMSQDDDPRSVQAHLIDARLAQLTDQIETHARNVGAADLRANRDSRRDPDLTAQFHAMSRHGTVLLDKKAFLQSMLLQTQEAQQKGRMTVGGESDSASSRPSWSKRDSKSKSSRPQVNQASPASSGISPGGLSDRPDNSIPLPSGTEFASDFTNRFVVHNIQLKWNNLLRNTILRYSHLVSQRRGFVYYLSRPAVKFILDIVEEQAKFKASRPSNPPTPAAFSGGTGAAAAASSVSVFTSASATTVAAGGSAAVNTAPPPQTKAMAGTAHAGHSATAAPVSDPASAEASVPNGFEEQLRKILDEGRKFVGTDDGGKTSTEGQNVGNYASASMGDLAGGIADGFTPQNNYHVWLIAPQIQLQSDKNTKHVVLVTAKGMELKVVEVLDEDRIFDSVSGLVQRRYLATMDSTQFFVTHQKWFASQMLSTYSGSTYGSAGGTSWPPWVPMEVVFDFQADPFGFRRVVQKTSAMLRYDKYNTLRLKYNDEVNSTSEGAGGKTSAHERGANQRPEGMPPGKGKPNREREGGDAATAAEKRVDNLWVEFPQARALCNSSQYYAMYVIVLDLLMYSEPSEKDRSERLEKIMLASDFSDLRGAPEMVVRLQERIRQLQDIRTHFQVFGRHLDAHRAADRLVLERDLAACEDELFFTMKAMTSSQRGRTDAASQSNALLRWSISAREIVWHLMRDNNEPLVELQLKDMEYDRTDNSDGSHINLVRVGKVLGLNLLPNAIYPEMVAPYVQDRAGRGRRADRASSSPARRGSHHPSSQPMIQVYWNMLEAIAGIPVMDHFEVKLFPMKVQLEREVGKKLFEYIFPGTERDAPEQEVLGPSGSDVARGAATGSQSDGRSPAVGMRGSLELRLRPTPSPDVRPLTAKQPKSPSVRSAEGSASHQFRLFRAGASGSSSRSASKKPSLESLRSGAGGGGGAGTPRPGIGRSWTGDSSLNSESKRMPRFAGLRGARHGGGGDHIKTEKGDRDDGGDGEGDARSDDLTQMISRASNYMTFAYIKMPSVVLCLSYKGKGDRNLEDVHDFVFRLPTIEYRNKTWSNLDLALALKGRVIKALISHTGAIIGNKFSRHRPGTVQQSKAPSSLLLATPTGFSDSRDNSDDSSSIFDPSPVDFSRSPPRSLHSSESSSILLQRPGSRSSSVASARSAHRAGGLASNGAGGSAAGSNTGVPAFLMMTPPTMEETSRPSSSFAPAPHNRRGGDAGEGGGSDGGGRLASGGGFVGEHAGERSSRRTGMGGMRERLTALTSRLKDRESSGLDFGASTDDGERQSGERGRRPPS